MSVLGSVDADQGLVKGFEMEFTLKIVVARTSKVVYSGCSGYGLKLQIVVWSDVN